MTSVNVSAPAKVILMGEHAVVYGEPAIAAPVSSLRVRAALSPSDREGGGLHIVSGDLRLPVSVTSETVDHALAHVARLVLRALDAAPPDVTITLTSDIPLASGLGSGAAVSAAVARALCAALETTLSNEALNALVYEAEKLYHGTPSGIDNTVIVYESPLVFTRGREPAPFELLRTGAALRLLIADTGVSASTRVAVSAVRTLVESDPAARQYVTQIGVLVRDAVGLLLEGDVAQFGSLMNANHRLLQRLTVSSPELDRLCEAAQAAGALGAKLTGGGRGGNMIALVTPATEADVRAALLAAGAARVFETTVESREETTG